MVEGRSWQSMKERFKRSILKRLDSFDLSEDARQQLKQGGKGVKGGEAGVKAVVIQQAIDLVNNRLL